MVDTYLNYKQKAVDLLKAIYGNNNNKFTDAYYKDLHNVINSIITIEQTNLLKELTEKDNTEIKDNANKIAKLEKSNAELVEEIKKLNKQITSTSKKKATSKETN